MEQVRPSHFRDDWAAVWISLLLACVVAGQDVSSHDPLDGNDLIALKRGFVDLSHRGKRVPLIAEASPWGRRTSDEAGRDGRPRHGGWNLEDSVGRSGAHGLGVLQQTINAEAAGRTSRFHPTLLQCLGGPVRPHEATLFRGGPGGAARCGPASSAGCWPRGEACHVVPRGDRWPTLFREAPSQLEAFIKLACGLGVSATALVEQRMRTSGIGLRSGNGYSSISLMCGASAITAADPTASGTNPISRTNS